jgi:hypothetical protein
MGAAKADIAIVDCGFLIVDSLGARGLLTNKLLDVASPVHNVKDSHIATLDAINHEITSDGNTSQSDAQVIAFAANPGMLCENQKLIGKGVYDTIGNFNAGTLAGDVTPDLVKLIFNLGAEKACQRPAERSTSS